MPHWLTHGAAIVQRIIAFALACLFFYVAIIMQENEEGIWQDRLVKLWVEVDDRAKITKSTATALFNRLAAGIKSMFDRLFGKSLLSVVSVLVSIALSISVFTFVLFFVTLSAHPTNKLVLAENFLVTIVLLPATLLTTRIQKMRRIALLSIVVLLPVVIFVYMFARGGEGPHHERIAIETTLLSLAISFACDFLAVTLIRKVMEKIATADTGVRVGYGVSALVGIAFLAEFLPLSLAGVGFMAFQIEGQRNEISSVLVAAALYPMMLSATTMCYCLAPLLVLLVVLSHRLMWPTLDRLIYPLQRYDIFKNKKLMMSFGATCLAVALDLQKTGIREILKHIS